MVFSAFEVIMADHLSSKQKPAASYDGEPVIVIQMMDKSDAMVDNV